jgi:glycosyltransferase involved in cell wall biosynthesis
MKRLGILTPTFGRGGSEDYIIALAGWAAQRGWTSTVCLPDVEALASVKEDLARIGASIRPLTASPRPEFSEEDFLNARRDTIRELRRQAFDRLVIVLPTIQWGGPHLDAAAAEDIPTAVLYQLIPHAFEFEPIQKYIYAAARRGRQVWAAVSQQNRDVLCESLEWTTDAVDVVPNALLRQIRPASRELRSALAVQVRDELRIPRGSEIVLSIGRLDHQKAYDVLLEAAVHVAEHHPSAHFVWLGAGELREEIQGAIGAAGLSGRVHLLGRRGDAERFLHAATMFVLPSRFEGRPFAAMEAMAAGVPCVLSDIGPHRELAPNGGEALLVSCTSAVPLAAAIREVLACEELRDALAAAALRRARCFAPGSSFEQLMKRLDEVAASDPAIAPWPLRPERRRRVAIFGAGVGGQRALEALASDVEVVAFLDGRAEIGTSVTVQGRPVMPPAAVRDLDVDGVIVASMHADEMCETLRGLGFASEAIVRFPVERLVATA